ncbi:P-loop containing nucleoside triphosphate hydrolase protein, partial [Mycena metata]
PNTSGNRLKSIAAYLEVAVGLVNDAAQVFEAPFLLSITKATSSLIHCIPNITRHQEESIELLENIHGVICGIVNLHLKSEAPGSLPPETSEHIGQFAQTLRKIDTLINSQQEGNRIKQLFRQGELSRMRKECRSGLREALALFKFAGSTTLLTNIDKMKEATDRMHTELLELVSGISDVPSLDGSSFTYQTSFRSSNSFSILPGKPKLFYGREREVEDMIQMLSQLSPRIAILGGGGMGKTTLAQTILHEHDIVRQYEHRFFVTAESTTNSVELASRIASHLGLGPGPDLTKAVVAYFAAGPPSLLILDNLETPWELLKSRAKVEEFLSLLADVEHLALVITMRGAERPAKVGWTRPFLAPLESLSDAATRKIFMEITDSAYDGPDVDELLRLTDNMPLAVDLIAHLVDYEGCATVLKRWQTEKTSLLSQGWDRKSSLAASITISLTSPRLESSPGARDLLALLSLLPDGLSDAQLVQSKLPIKGILACKVALLATSLAYQDSQKRIKSLTPIREHIQQWSPPSLDLILALIKYYHSQLGLFQRYYGTQDMGSIINQATLNRGNLHQLLEWAL